MPESTTENYRRALGDALTTLDKLQAESTEFDGFYIKQTMARVQERMGELEDE